MEVVRGRNVVEGLGLDDRKILTWKIRNRIRWRGLDHLAPKRGQLLPLVNTAINFLVKCSDDFPGEVSYY
jgi:hypothetical protein